MPSRDETRKAGGNDIGDWGEKQTDGAYPPGTKFDLGDGKPIDVTKVPDILGGKSPKRPVKRPRIARSR